ncbi:hypothetical protein [Pueribacillus sp. YX66]|uniref:hypothetical protein n=1 Tax=Pueribacillus sp. YX66 TaxID=3229242 RepID=UPI00358D5EE2
MRKVKSIILTASIAVVIIAIGSITAQGLTHQHISMGSGATVYIQGYNTVGVKGTGLYGTNKNKVVTGCKVRLREGNFDKSANNYAKRGGWTAKLSKVNNPLKTAYTTYSWRY